jgi:chromosome segregation ATPase
MVVKDHGVTGVHGRLIDLISVPPQLQRAVEQTARSVSDHVQPKLSSASVCPHDTA